MRERSCFAVRPNEKMEGRDPSGAKTTGAGAFFVHELLRFPPDPP
jgi:hypothetical protein